MGLNLWSKKINITKAPTTTSTPMTSEKTSQTKEASQSYRTTKQPTAVAGGKKRATNNRQIGRITKEHFELIHLLHERGLKNVEIANIVKLSAQRVGFVINHCPTWEAYEARKEEDLLAWREKQAARVARAKEAHHEDKELEQWQFIVGWSNESQRIQANAVRDLARALGLRVEE